MNARYMLSITAIIVSTVFLTLVTLFAGGAGFLFGFIAVAAILLRFASFLGFFNIPPLARGLSNGAIIIALIVIIIVGISRQISFAPSLSDRPSASATAKKSLSIIWDEPQIIEVSVEDWSRAYNVGGSEYFRASPDENGVVEVLADGRYIGQLSKNKQLDIDTAKELKFRSIGKKSKVYLRFGRSV